MACINPQHIEQLMAMINASPYMELLDLRLVEMRDNYCRATLDLGHKHMNMLGGAHGGAYASLMDVGAYWPLYCTLPDGVGFTTLDLSVDNLRSAREGLVTVEGRVIKQGGSIGLTEAEARDEQGRLLIHAQSKLFISDRIPSIAQSAESLGMGTLPPKFLDEGSDPRERP